MIVTYRLPEPSDKEIIQAYIQDHFDNGENSISASLGLMVQEYNEWVQKIQNNSTTGDKDWGKSLLYLCFQEEKLIGLLSIRYELSKELSEKIGDIGYGVRPSHLVRSHVCHACSTRDICCARRIATLAVLAHLRPAVCGEGVIPKQN